MVRNDDKDITLDLPIFKPEPVLGTVNFAELFIVILFIGVIVAVAIPNMVRSRGGNGNEAAAQGSCKTIAGAQCDYNGNANPHTYAWTLKQLSTGQGAGGVGFMDSALGSGLKSGYTFHMEVGAPYMGSGTTSYWAWSAAAWPVAYKSTGVRSFYIDESGVVRGQDLRGKRGRIAMPALD